MPLGLPLVCLACACARVACLACLGRRVSGRKNFLKIWGCSWGCVDHVGIFKHPIWAMYEKLLASVGYVLYINVFIVVSQIWRLIPMTSAVKGDSGAMTLWHTSEWAFGFQYILIYLIFSQKMCLNESMLWKCHAYWIMPKLWVELFA